MKKTVLLALAAGALLLLWALAGREKRAPMPRIVVPAIALDVKSAAPPREETTILVLALEPGRCELVSSAEKPLHWEPEGEGRARWVLEDAGSGLPLAQDSCDLPELCKCSLGHDHARGCIVLHHRAVFRLKVPRKAPHERLRLLSETGRELGAFSLESAS